VKAVFSPEVMRCALSRLTSSFILFLIQEIDSRNRP
jgi:hypothetical protein